ncbi:PAPA-1-like conserved region-domain-containing protein [Hypoxylon trugodes]|uniref:PAPA-1-like conserved region-domain-containing protein n=1 Tax=Hypoxylon trugodes TaxID=326681 RepID=UPI002196FC45|nr:PAPA-1-like conserved region-domain-containing protein [Hypoxylon trugodes]KAI1388461.1 PAPA-1-like conserved region-domain-containing protein [Hypoxylon trugodes]
MTSRPRRAAAQRANTAITDMVDSDNHINSRTGRTMSSRTSRRSEGKSVAATVSRGPPSSPSDSNQHIHFTVKLPASKLRQATTSRSGQSSRQQTSAPGIVEGKRNRFQKKSYVVDSSDDDDEDAEDEVQVDEEEEDDDDDDDAEGEDDDMEDAEGEIIVDDTMDIDAEGDDDEIGEEDAEGEDDDMDVDNIPPPAPMIKVSKPSAKNTPSSKLKAPAKSSMKASTTQAKDSDDEELSELESEADEIQDTVKVGGGDDEDAEGEDEEIEAANPADDDDLGSDGDPESRAETPDLTRMTKRQRARFEENGDALMKLSDEVQAKKHFTAEELSMRRAEMARRRRNLSEKRNEEVKMETINKLLKKQAPKTKGKGQLAGDQTPDVDANKPNPVFVRWISSKEGSRVGVPDEMLAGPAGKTFIPGGLGSGKMVEEVS